MVSLRRSALTWFLLLTVSCQRTTCELLPASFVRVSVTCSSQVRSATYSRNRITPTKHSVVMLRDDTKRHQTKLMATTTNSKESQRIEREEDQLTPLAVSEMVEVTFVNACMDLAKGYVDILKLFIVAVKSAYGLGIPIAELLRLVNSCEVQSANRPLMHEEVQLRATWISVVYMTLERLRYRERVDFKLLNEEELTHVEGVDKATFLKFSGLVEHVIDAREEGAVLSHLGVEKFLEDGGFLESAKSDSFEKTILSQSARVVLLTLTVLEEEMIFERDRGRGGPKPQPPIPGTSGY